MRQALGASAYNPCPGGFEAAWTGRPYIQIVAQRRSRRTQSVFGGFPLEGFPLSAWTGQSRGRVSLMRERLSAMEQTKIGLVVEGGGMKCAYNAGILDAFLDRGISFDYCIGVSAGAGNLAPCTRSLKRFTVFPIGIILDSRNFFPFPGRVPPCFNPKDATIDWRRPILPNSAASSAGKACDPEREQTLPARGDAV